MIPSRRRFIKIAAAQTSAIALTLASQNLISSPFPIILRQWKGIVLGAEASIQLSCNSEQQADRVLKHCVSEIQRLEQIFSLYDEHSSLSQLNKRKILPSPPEELVELLKTAQEFGHTTQGIFDVTIQPIVTAYRKHFSKSETGLPADLEQAKQAVDFRKIHISDNEIALLNKQASITLNGIAQGFITDYVSNMLRQEGLGYTLVDLGEKRALDTHPTGRNWQLGLANSFGIHNVVELNDKALSSSGGYGTPFDKSGKHHHLIDPRTGLSVNHHSSIHVVAPTATLADALSTTLATCQHEESKRIEERFPEVAVFRS